MNDTLLWLYLIALPPGAVIFALGLMMIVTLIKAWKGYDYE